MLFRSSIMSASSPSFINVALPRLPLERAHSSITSNLLYARSLFVPHRRISPNTQSQNSKRTPQKTVKKIFCILLFYHIFDKETTILIYIARYAANFTQNARRIFQEFLPSLYLSIRLSVPVNYVKIKRNDI